MSKVALHQLAHRIAAETFAVWEEYERKGIADAVPHLESALRTLGRCGVGPDQLPFPDWLCRRDARPWTAHRRTTVCAMGFIGMASHKKIVGCLLRRLRSPIWRVRRDALAALRQLEVSSHEEDVFLRAAQELQSRRMAVRVAAAHLLIFWERQEGEQRLHTRLAPLGSGSKNAAYLLDLARDVARAQQAQEREDATPTSNVDASPVQHSDSRRREIERLLARLNSSRAEERRRAARVLGERMQAGWRIFERQGRTVIALPSDAPPSTIKTKLL